MRFLTSKTSFSAFIFSQAQIGPKNFEKIHRTVFSYYKWPWIFSEFLELMYASEKSLKFWMNYQGHRNVTATIYRKFQWFFKCKADISSKILHQLNIFWAIGVVKKLTSLSIWGCYSNTTARFATVDHVQKYDYIYRYIYAIYIHMTLVYISRRMFLHVFLMFVRWCDFYLILGSKLVWFWYI